MQKFMEKSSVNKSVDNVEKKAENPVQKKEYSAVDYLKSAPVQKKTENNTGLPDNLKSGIESMSGISLDDVNVHYNSSKPAQMKALAYTQGTDIHVAPGQEKHLGHEAWHVVQQKQGRVAPTTQMKGINVNDSPALEHEADVMGNKAIQFKTSNTRNIVQYKKNKSVNVNLVQLKKDEKYFFEDVNDLKLNPYFLNEKERKNYFKYEKKINSAKDKDKKLKKFLKESDGFKNYTALYKKIKGFSDKIKKPDGRKDIWESIKKAFFSKKNIDTIIGKTFSNSTGANLLNGMAIYNDIDKKIRKSVENDLKITISQTLSDIFYWSNDIEGKKVSEIKLTDSDVHARGVGVCIVTFEKDENGNEKNW